MSSRVVVGTACMCWRGVAQSFAVVAHLSSVHKQHGCQHSISLSEVRLHLKRQHDHIHVNKADLRCDDNTQQASMVTPFLLPDQEDGHHDRYQEGE